MSAAGKLRLVDGWRVEVGDLRSSQHLVLTYHYSKSVPNTATFCHALFDPHGVQAGAAIWIPPTRSAAERLAGEGWRGVISLSRLVVAPDVPGNGASFLLGRSMSMIDRRRWPWLVTYADSRMGHDGGIYRATNWQDDGLVAAGDVWVHRDTGVQRGRKRGGRTLLASEMSALGFDRAPALPKRRFIQGPPLALRRLEATR